MLFHEPFFVFVFLPLVVLLFYFLSRYRAAWAYLWLIVASLFFYAWWKAYYLPLFLLISMATYAIADAMHRIERPKPRAALLILGLVVNFGTLAYYKYGNFAVDTFNLLSGKNFQIIPIILPLAISFFTFTQTAYLIDIWKKRELHHSFRDYCLFVFFFPHLIAGPILRHWEIIPQFKENKKVGLFENIHIGTLIFIIGLCKKVLLADPLAEMSSPVFSAVSSGQPVTSYEAWQSLLAYTGQIYFDFSGYSDMAIGAARMFGISFPSNFNSPYKSVSIADFWTRWHMTLGRFLKDYLYIPLGGNRAGNARTVINLMLTMVICGIWHGAGWQFIFWGLGHGILMGIHRTWSFCKFGWSWLPRVSAVVSPVLTFFFVMLLWVLFRSDSLGTAANYYRTLFPAGGFSFPESLSANLQFLPGVRFGGDRILDTRMGWDWAQILFIFALAWFAPNTQQLMKPWNPTLDSDKIPARFSLKIGWPLGILAGVLFALVIKSYFKASPSEFLYFNF